MGANSQSSSSDRPFSYRRRVLWGDCDPENVIYTPRAFDYLMEALEAWSIEVIGLRWIQYREVLKLGTPTVHTECDYLSVLRAGMVVDLTVRIERLGNSSMTFAVSMTGLDGTPHMRFKHTTCFITLNDFKAAPVPAEVRAKIEAYQAACGDA